MLAIRPIQLRMPSGPRPALCYHFGILRSSAPMPDVPAAPGRTPPSPARRGILPMPSLTLARIEELAARGESEFLEFKQSTGQRGEAAKTVCGMLNRPQPNGRYVLFGVSPDGRPVGQQMGDRTIEDVSAELQEISPKVSPRIDRVPVTEGREVIAVAVPAADRPPYTYRRQPYRRVGNTTSVMPEDEYQRILLERAHREGVRWENRPAEGWSLDELDAGRIHYVIDLAKQRRKLNVPNSRNPADLLQGLGLYSEGVLRKSAVVLFAKAEPMEARMPQCLLRAARFRGTDRTEFLDNRQFHGNAFDLLEHAERFLSETTPVAGKIVPSNMARVDKPLYPPDATREALVNALCHRDYSIAGGSIHVAVYDDRLEVTSTGPLPFGLTPRVLLESEGPVSKPWNPDIAGAFARCGFSERWGRGAAQMAKLAVDTGLPRPQILDENECVTVRFWNDHHAAQRHGTDSRKQMILSLLKRASDNGLSKREIHDRLVPPASERQVRRALEELQEEKLARSTKSGPAARWKLTDEERRRQDEADIPF